MSSEILTFLSAQGEFKQAADNRVVFSFMLPDSHPFFDGHYPTRPILAGAAHIALVRELVGKALGKPVRVKSVRRSKFLQIVPPCTELILHVDVSPDENKASWNMYLARALCSKGSLTYETS